MQVGFLGLLTLIFAAAKVFGLTAMSWLWVFSPLWIGIPVVLVTIFLVVMFLAVLKA